MSTEAHWFGIVLIVVVAVGLISATWAVENVKAECDTFGKTKMFRVVYVCTKQ